MDYEDIIALLSGATVGIIILILLFFIAGAIFSIVSAWKMYKKMGKPGWASIIPIYSTWVLVEAVELNWWWFLIASATSLVSLLNLDFFSSLATIATIFANVIINYNLAKKFNKDVGFVVLLTLLPIIGYAVLGLSKDCIFDSSVVVGKNGFLGNNNNNNVNQNNQSFHNTNENINDQNISFEKTVEQPNVNNNETVFCTNCGNKMNKSDKFCTRCGKQNY